ncbi:alpha-amylase [Streptomyces purpurogeneiscleroticus]|uniref:alpha-amylase n=1 Tax=Streptomyces purpurogeneiscleroticus TaxID=68259 RepID=UPI001CBF7937|nr:alpha-amylase [Streptomyces purpurogeneiscleroticus]MBZ4018316.1 alpha-amylase [Streptomyces purpurogeneiscleroticus]
MRPLPEQPVIHEVNTHVWLREVQRSIGRRVGLGGVPKDAWDRITPHGIDAVWLMGVWERSDVGRDIALRNPGLRRSFAEALPDVRDDDIAGSPYCVRGYTVDEALGGAAGLASARAELAGRGIGLLLDYVPNHVAPDSPWLTEHPEYFVRGTPDDLHRDPAAYLESGGHVFARGRDPFFPPWPDVVQLNAFQPGMRAATADVLTRIGGMCDGVRCDMAMLMMNDVFARTWGHRAGPPPDAEFWSTVLTAVRRHRPDMAFIAEAYWELEWALQQQGFDYCYDKRLYDRLLHERAVSVLQHLRADVSYQRRLVRFLENHDEPRAASLLSPSEERAAAVAIATLPGATLWHEGQFTGRRTRLPVFLTRRPEEPPDAGLQAFHERLLAAVHRSGMRTGHWELLHCEGWADNPTHHDLLAWSWRGTAGTFLIVVNLAAHSSQARIRLPWPDLGTAACRLTDLLDGTRYERPGSELTGSGLFVDLAAWRTHVFTVESPEAESSEAAP